MFQHLMFQGEQGYAVHKTSVGHFTLNTEVIVHYV